MQWAVHGTDALPSRARAHDRAGGAMPPPARFLSGRRLAPAEVLHLQRTGGNAAVGRLLQRQAETSAGSGPCCEACDAGEACEESGALPAGVAVLSDLGADASAPDRLTSPRFAGDPVLEACYEDRARLGVGDTGRSVVAVQKALIDLGYDLGASGADSVYGNATATAVRAFKRDEELGFEQYGDVGPGTMHRLDYLFPPPDGNPLCRGDSPDVPVAATADLEAAPANGGPLLAFGIPSVFCQLGASISKFADIPAEVRRSLQVSYGSGPSLDQKVLDEAYTPWTDRFLKNPKPPAKLSMPVLFGAGVPATPVVRESLRRVIFMITGPGGVLPPSSTTNLNLGTVQDAAGNAMPGGVFRFTRFRVGKIPESVLVERLGNSAEPPPSFFAMDKTQFELAWKPRNFKLGRGWDDKTRIGQLQWVLVNSPQKALFTMFRDITFEYTPKPAGSDEDGRWDHPTKTLSLHHGVFDASAQRVGTMPYYAFVTFHELGHALEMTFDPPGLAEFSKALKADGDTPVTSYGRRNAHESFAEAFAVFVLDHEQLSGLRPKVAEFFMKRYVR